ncbi:MAG TPA: hypothetical protein VFA05_03575 [Gaiellaceae bacterium]|nr:hypothetical protein [Gaiellaceae bacterium]
MRKSLLAAVPLLLVLAGCGSSGKSVLSVKTVSATFARADVILRPAPSAPYYAGTVGDAGRPIVFVVAYRAVGQAQSVKSGRQIRKTLRSGFAPMYRVKNVIVLVPLADSHVEHRRALRVVAALYRL